MSYSLGLYMRCSKVMKSIVYINWLYHIYVLLFAYLLDFKVIFHLFVFAHLLNTIDTNNDVRYWEIVVCNSNMIIMCIKIHIMLLFKKLGWRYCSHMCCYCRSYSYCTSFARGRSRYQHSE